MADGEHFDMPTWAKGHEALDEARFQSLSQTLNRVISVIGVGLMIVIGLCSWSLKANYDSIDKQVHVVEQLRK
jgi:hypothetical protein